ncbi:phosphatidylserine/phosphatidylglycerophosphate/cardiolipin synthase family protein [Micromonospora peucetia]|uniref:phosphatidylserine/phosphatidylglycerophosphate/ cardiolipin synthase family protein n=1 Tax=Micromonospora peucetia TaxID=47871 RepID=UPI00332227D8
MTRSAGLRGLAMAVVATTALSLPIAPASAANPTGEVPAAAAAAVPIAASEVRNHTWFNQKTDSDMHGGLVGHVSRLVNAAPAGATLSLTLYFFNRQEIVDALRGAAARGVRVRVVINGSQVGTAHHTALKSIPNLRLVTCGERRSDGQSTRGCVSTRTGAKPLNNPPLLHNKFMTISSVQLAGGGTARNVLYVSSANLDSYRAYENAITISHAGLYNTYLGYFNDLMRYGSSGRTSPNYGRTTTVGTHRVYTFPRREAAGKTPGSASNDPIASLLKSTDCSGGTRIDLANFRIQRAAVVKELKAAASRGCQVRIVTGAKSGRRHDVGPPMKALVDLARAMPVHLCGYTEAGGIPMHEKFMIIRRGGQSTLYTGSHNLTYRALRQNDENILALRNHPLAAPFQQRFEQHHSTCLPYQPPANAGATADVEDAG